MVLGLDAATKKTGYALMDSPDKLIDFGLIETDTDGYIPRIQEIYFKIRDILKKNKKIDVIVLEDVPINYKNNLKTAKELMALQGMILSLSFQFNIKVKLYNPSAHRSLNGLYNGTKESMKREFQKAAAVDKVNNLYNLNLNYFVRDTKKNKSDDDKAEAILIARAFFLDKDVNKEE